MPDADGNLKGQGWSRKREQGWERAFASKREGLDVVADVIARTVDEFARRQRKTDA